MNKTFPQLILEHKVKYLYHFTPLKNIFSILCNDGLLSREKQKNKQIKAIRYHGWGSKGQQLSNYICLSLHPPKAMMKYEKEPLALLIIRPEIISRPGVLFSPLNTADRRVLINQLLQQTGEQNFANLFQGPFTNITKDYQAEILIPEKVALKEIKTIVVDNYRDLQKVKYKRWWVRLIRLLKAQKPYLPPVIIDKSLSLFP